MSKRIRNPYDRLPECPICGMDSGVRKITDTVPEKCYVICETCGYKAGPCKSMSSAVSEWKKGKKHKGDIK